MGSVHQRSMRFKIGRQVIEDKICFPLYSTMPQSHNPTRMRDDDSSAFGKNSRFASVANEIKERQRKMEMAHQQHLKSNELYLRSINTRAKAEIHRLDRIKVKLLDNLKKTAAYSVVLKQNRYNEIFKVDKKKAMSIEFTVRGMRNHITEVIKQMDPAYKRQIEARSNLEATKAEYDLIIARNIKRIPTARTRERRRLRRELQEANRELDMGHDEGDAAFVLTPSPIPQVAADLRTPSPQPNLPPTPPPPKINLRGVKSKTPQVKPMADHFDAKELPPIKLRPAKLPAIQINKSDAPKSVVIEDGSPSATAHTSKPNEPGQPLSVVDISDLKRDPAKPMRTGKRASVPVVRKGSTVVKGEKADELRLPPVRKPSVMVARPKFKMNHRDEHAPKNLQQEKFKMVLPPIQG